MKHNEIYYETSNGKLKERARLEVKVENDINIIIILRSFFVFFDFLSAKLDKKKIK